MLEVFNLFILGLIIICAIASLAVKDLITSAMLLGIYSFVICLFYSILGAVDVAFTEAAVGAGISTVFFIVTILKTERKSKD